MPQPTVVPRSTSRRASAPCWSRRVAVVEDSRCPINARCVWAGRADRAHRVDGAGWRETTRPRRWASRSPRTACRVALTLGRAGRRWPGRNRALAAGPLHRSASMAAARRPTPRGSRRSRLPSERSNSSSLMSCAEVRQQGAAEAGDHAADSWPARAGFGAAEAARQRDHAQHLGMIDQRLEQARPRPEATA